MQAPRGGCLRSARRATRWLPTASAIRAAAPTRTIVAPPERVLDVAKRVMIVLWRARRTGSTAVAECCRDVDGRGRGNATEQPVVSIALFGPRYSKPQVGW